MTIMGRKLFGAELTKRVLGSAFEVHKELGPGLLESTYRRCLLHELKISGLEAQSEVSIPVTYKGIQIDCMYRADILVEGAVLLELKAVEKLLPVHEAQLLTYLKLSGLKVGFLFNFNAIHLRDGFRRLVA
jgi:GxxExxY protein